MEDDTNIGNGSDERKPDGIGIILFGIYLVFLMLTVVIIGRIVYIHPQRRYFLAEAKVGNAVIRECFPMTPK